MTRRPCTTVFCRCGLLSCRGCGARLCEMELSDESRCAVCEHRAQTRRRERESEATVAR